MQRKPHTTAKRRSRPTGFFGLALLLALTWLAGPVSPAQAAPVNLTLDNGRLTIGIFDDRVILPASDTFPSDDLPTPQRTDIQLNGDLADDGKLSVPASLNTGLQFPYMHLMHPFEPGLRIPVTMRLNPPGLTGTWNEATGAMRLQGKLDMVVVTGTGTGFPLPDTLDDLGVPPLGLFARCRINDVPVDFTTDKRYPRIAQPFTGGFGKKGAIATNWPKLPQAKSENGGECDDLNRLLNSAGGLWFSNGIVKPKPVPPGLNPVCETDPELCERSRYVDIDGLRLKANKRKVRPGQKVTMIVRVHNGGTRDARNLKVRVWSSNPRVKTPKKVSLFVPAGSWSSKKFTVRVKRKAKKGGARISVAKNGYSRSKFLKIRPKSRRSHR